MRRVPVARILQFCLATGSLILAACVDENGEEGLIPSKGLSIQVATKDPFVIRWANATSNLPSNQRPTSPFRISVTVNGVYNSTLDVQVAGHEVAGTLELPSGWMAQILRWSSPDREVQVLRGHVGVFWCPPAFTGNPSSLPTSSSESLAALPPYGCVQTGEKTFSALAFRFKTRRSIESDFAVQLHIPFSGVREAVLRALPPNLVPSKSNLVLDFIHHFTVDLLEHRVFPNDNLVLDVFGGDDALRQAQEDICMETIPDLAGLQAEAMQKPWYPFGVGYAQKLGSLVLAVSAFNLSLCIETGSFNGETAVHLAAVCETVITVELSPELAANVEHTLAWARSSFGRNVSLLVGDSAELLWAAAIQADARPALFFLDGHFSGASTAKRAEGEQHAGSPLLLELEAVFARANERDVIVIDDASDLLDPGKAAAMGYPSILDVFRAVCRLAPASQVQIKDGLVRIFRHHAPAELPNGCANFGAYHGHVDYTISGEASPRCYAQGPGAWAFPDGV